MRTLTPHAAWIVTLVFAAAACAPAAETAPPPAAPVATAEPAPAPEPAPVAAPAPVLTPEQQKAQEEQKKLDAEFAKLEAENKAELARLTPEVRTAGKTLAEKSYPSTKAALTAALASPHRQPGNAERDASRHPVATLEFFGLRPNQTVLEYGPGEGWYTELLAPTLAAKGKLIVTSPDPAGSRDQRATLYGQRTKAFLAALPEVYGKVETVTIDPKAPKLPFENTLDSVLLIRGLHGMQNNGVLQAWLAEFHRALKPGGIIGVEQHRAKPDADPAVSSKQGYLPESFVIQQMELAGFKLVAKSEINANPKDTKDHPEGVWTLPPTLRLGDKDKEKYLAIGESDRMTLKFSKVAKPQAPKAAAAPAAPKSPALATPATAAAKPAAPAAPATPGAAASKPATPASPATPAAPAAPAAKPAPAATGAAPSAPAVPPAGKTPAPAGTAKP
jgi:predicted methyltransferase